MLGCRSFVMCRFRASPPHRRHPRRPPPLPNQPYPDPGWTSPHQSSTRPPTRRSARRKRRRYSRVSSTRVRCRCSLSHVSRFWQDGRRPLRGGGLCCFAVFSQQLGGRLLFDGLEGRLRCAHHVLHRIGSLCMYPQAVRLHLRRTRNHRSIVRARHASCPGTSCPRPRGRRQR